MRERYLDAFDAIRVDCLNGDKYKTGKVAPDGSPDPSIFSTEGDPVGIQVGTAIATLVRKVGPQASPIRVDFRHLWGQAKLRGSGCDTADAEIGHPILRRLFLTLPLGLPFRANRGECTDWFDWPSLPDLFPDFLSRSARRGRDAFLVDIDLDQLRAASSKTTFDRVAQRMKSYRATISQAS